MMHGRSQRRSERTKGGLSAVCSVGVTMQCSKCGGLCFYSAPHLSIAVVRSAKMPKSETSLDLSSSSSSISYDSDDDFRLAQKEWDESLEQLQQLVSVVLLPFFGKWLGRRWSHWGASSTTIIRGCITHFLSQFLRAICDLDWESHSFWAQ